MGGWNTRITGRHNLQYCLWNSFQGEGSNMKKLGGFLIICCCGLLLLAGQAQAESDYTKPQELIDQSVIVVKRFAADEQFGNFRSLVKNAKAVFVVPKMLKAGFFLGGSGGSGALLSRDSQSGEWSYPVFYTMGAVSFGAQIGAESSELIMLVMTDRGMDSMLASSFKLGADATVAVGPVGAGAKAATADVLSFALSKGAYAGASVEGAVLKTRDDWNGTYYGKKVSPADIIIRKNATNNAANELRKVVTEIANTKS